MPNIAAFLAPLALMLPFAAAQEEPARLSAVPPAADADEAEVSPEWLKLDDLTDVPVQHQIRIERRIVVRISPYRPARSTLTADTPRQRRQPKLEERKIGKCVKLEGIAAVRPTQDNRLLLYMRDQRLIAANLEKACSARDFYQGFYVEPRKDGKLCIERDELQSRTGVKCELSRIRQLVPETS